MDTYELMLSNTTLAMPSIPDMNLARVKESLRVPEASSFHGVVNGARVADDYVPKAGDKLTFEYCGEGLGSDGHLTNDEALLIAGVRVDKKDRRPMTVEDQRRVEDHLRTCSGCETVAKRYEGYMMK